MDISVLASVGSFVVSERVLKPKASVLVLLGCLLAYDLTTKTHDVSSLRVYRGPGLLAFSLMMVALSLRTWRRNGVACDELLFLPGTPHGESTESSSSMNLSSRPQQQQQQQRSEGDVAAGWAERNNNNNTVEMVLRTPVSEARNRTHSSPSQDSSLSSINEFLNSWDEEDDAVDLEGGDNLLIVNETHDAALSGEMQPLERPPNQVERFSENHPRITRLGTFFFFRSSSTSTQNATYAPSGPSVMGAALDLSMPVLFNFHLFIEAWNHLDSYGSEAPAKILPMIFLSVLIVRTVFPPSRRGRFWGTMKHTAMAPLTQSRFRDSYIGDILTSLVRPMQDVVFALAYYVTVIWGTITAKYGLSDSGEMLETSWLLHNVVLPSCALLPLWWKFLQTLRETYDGGLRWPYLGNSFKFLTAAMVILYGMTHPEDRRSPWWILAFAFALVYQVLWDTLVDWELFVIVPKDSAEMDKSDPGWFTQVSSVRPGSYRLTLHHVLRPVRDMLRRMIARIPSFKQIRLRPRRLYKSESFYWRIFAYNTAFRFCWMLSFIPAYHLSASGRDVVTTFSSDTKSYVGVLLPIAEIVRRTLWGFLYLEMQTIKMSDGDPKYTYSRVEAQDEGECDTELSNGSVHSNNKHNRYYLPAWLGTQQQLQHDAATTSSSWKISSWFHYSDRTRDKLFVVELSLWAAAFVGFGFWASR